MLPELGFYLLLLATTAALLLVIVPQLGLLKKNTTPLSQQEIKIPKI